MLKAMVLVCSLVTQNDCAEFIDNTKLYDTQEQCKARVHEMIRDITPTLPAIPVQFYFKCEQVDSI